MRRIPYEECRRRGHEWDDVTGVVKWDPPFGMEPYVLRCVNCYGVRIDGIDGLGRLGLRRYEMPDDWHMTKVDLPSRTELRRQWVAKKKKTRRGKPAAKKTRALKAVS